MGSDFDEFISNFSFVTDFTAVIPTIVGSSTSDSVAPRDEKWFPLVAHELNTPMTNIMKELKSAKESDDFEVTTYPDSKLFDDRSNIAK